MRSWVATKAYCSLVILLLLTGCGDTTKGKGKKSTPEAVKIAFNFLQNGEIEPLRALLAKNPSIANTLYREDSLLNLVIDTRPAYPQMFASTKVLLEAGADPNLNAPQLLRKAIWRREPEVYKLLLKHGANPRIIWEKKGIDMLEYSQSFGDERFEKISDAWVEANEY